MLLFDLKGCNLYFCGFASLIEEMNVYTDSRDTILFTYNRCNYHTSMVITILYLRV